MQRTAHHRAHAEQGVEAGRRGVTGREPLPDDAERAAGAGTHDERRPDQAAGQPQPDAGGRRQQLEAEHQRQRAEGELAEQGGVGGVVADAHHLRCGQRAQPDDHAGERRAQPEGDAGTVLGREPDQRDERRREQPDGNADGEHEGQLPQRAELHLRHDERRLGAVLEARQRGRAHRGEDHRREADHGVLHQHHFHGEDDAGERRVERGGDRRRDAAAGEHAQAVVRQAEALPGEAAARRAEVDRRPFASRPSGRTRSTARRRRTAGLRCAAAGDPGGRRGVP